MMTLKYNLVGVIKNRLKIRHRKKGASGSLRVERERGKAASTKPIPTMLCAAWSEWEMEMYADVMLCITSTLMALYAWNKKSSPTQSLYHLG